MGEMLGWLCGESKQDKGEEKFSVIMYVGHRHGSIAWKIYAMILLLLSVLTVTALILVSI